MPALEVQHFQFLSWPDHGVPKFSTALISFIRRLRQYHNPQSAMLVHCSAGVGRTGAFILLDSMLEKIASESSVNVYECLTKMRQQRIHLVQTLVCWRGKRGGRRVSVSWGSRWSVGEGREGVEE